MGLSTSTMRGLIRYLPGTGKTKGAAVPRLVIHPGDTTPVYEPFYIRPTEVPSGTLAEGAIWFDDDNHTLGFYNGSANREVASVPAGQGTVPLYRPIKNAATTLTSDDNGALCVWSTAAGYLYTLPAAAVGLWFDFLVTTTITSVGAKVICASGDFIVGSYLQIPDTAAQIVAHAANGSTHVSWNGNGTTTGGYAGESFRLTAISGTQWAISGIGLATGAEATPFATS